MLPVNMFNQIVLEEEEKRAQIRAENLERRVMRDSSDPFELSDKTFKDLFRLSKDMVHGICQTLLPFMQRTSVLAVDPVIRIFAALYFFATGSYQTTVGQSWNLSISQPVVSRCIAEVSALIEEHLAPTWIRFPTTAQQINQCKARFMERTRFPGVLGAVDCTHVAILAPKEEEHNYINRKGFHSKNVQIICDYNLRILNINARFPGSNHDSYIWRNSNIRTELERRYNEGDRNTWLLGDSGYPQEPWLMTPIVNAAEGTPEFRYTERHVTARNIIERCNGVLKTRFRCIMGERKLRYQPDIVARIINTCAVLHNMCVEELHLNENIFVPNDIEEPEHQILIEPANNAGFQSRRLLIEQYFQ